MKTNNKNNHSVKQVLLSGLILMSSVIKAAAQTDSNGEVNFNASQIQGIVTMGYRIATAIAMIIIITVIIRGMIKVMSEEQGAWKSIGAAVIVGILWFVVVPQAINFFLGLAKINAKL